MNLSPRAKRIGLLLGLAGVLIGIIGFVFIYPAYQKSAESKRASSVRVFTDPSFLENKAKAEQGDAEAQFLVGYRYIGTIGLAGDTAEAMKWFRKAAEQNHAKAQAQLGIHYQTRSLLRVFVLRSYHDVLGSWESDREAFKWLRKSAEQNEALAFYPLGGCYERGLGVEKDSKEAWKWYRRHFEERFLANKAKAEHGDAAAQSQTAVNYVLGQGVGKDYVEAYAWYDLAALTIGKAASERDRLKSEMSEQKVDDARKRAEELRAQIEAKRKSAGK
ncbi:MAG: tetratricopeptide repeat protein [Limisphaerales bacterium]